VLSVAPLRLVHGADRHRGREVDVEMGAKGDGASANAVRLRGRVSTGPTERELPSGSVVVAVRLSVPRDASPMTKGSRQTVDWVDCSAWGAAQRRAASRWREGDVVEVDGALRRRSSRGAGGFTTRVEVEILGGRVVRRADA
jgi:single-strand DNA-binding protein